MPAITVDNPLLLPRLRGPQLADMPRPVRKIVTAISTFEGEGFPVRRPFPGKLSLGEADPFLLLDQMGEVDYAPGEPKGTPWHPHRGFETVTYIMDGAFAHQDSTGGGGLISDGDTQWMTAGSGLLHIETPPEELVMSGGLFHGVQLWVNLPRDAKMTNPKYQDLHRGQVGLLTSADGGALVRVIAGEISGVTGPGTTYTPINYAHITVDAGAQVDMIWPEEFNAMVYSLAGNGWVGPEHTPLREGQLALYGEGQYLQFGAANKQDSRIGKLELLVLGGKPIREPIFHYGPFVMNTRDEVIQAVNDFQAGRMGVIPPVEKLPHT